MLRLRASCRRFSRAPQLAALLAIQCASTSSSSIRLSPANESHGGLEYANSSVAASLCDNIGCVTTRRTGAPPMHAEIAGAGFAGLAAAIALHRRGWSVIVHEKEAELRAFGAGIFIWE